MRVLRDGFLCQILRASLWVLFSALAILSAPISADAENESSEASLDPLPQPQSQPSKPREISFRPAMTVTACKIIPESGVCPDDQKAGWPTEDAYLRQPDEWPADGMIEKAIFAGTSNERRWIKVHFYYFAFNRPECAAIRNDGFLTVNDPQVGGARSFSPEQALRLRNYPPERMNEDIKKYLVREKGATGRTIVNCISEGEGWVDKDNLVEWTPSFQPRTRLKPPIEIEPEPPAKRKLPVPASQVKEYHKSEPDPKPERPVPPPSSVSRDRPTAEHPRPAPRLPVRTRSMPAHVVCPDIHKDTLGEHQQICETTLRLSSETERQIKSRLGHCVRGPNSWSHTPVRGSGYERYFKPYWKNQSAPRDITLPFGRKLTKDDLRIMDGIARTIYGEALSCQWRTRDRQLTFEPGHFEAIGKIIVDRAHLLRENPNEMTSHFGTWDTKIRKTKRGNQKIAIPSSMHPAEQAISRFQAFSVWNATEEGRHNPALKRSLCPVNIQNAHIHSEKGEISFRDEALWDWAADLAMQAYLNPSGYDRYFPWEPRPRNLPITGERIAFYTHGSSSPRSNTHNYMKIDQPKIRDYDISRKDRMCNGINFFKAVPKSESSETTNLKSKNRDDLS